MQMQLQCPWHPHSRLSTCHHAVAPRLLLSSRQHRGHAACHAARDVPLEIALSELPARRHLAPLVSLAAAAVLSLSACAAPAAAQDELSSDNPLLDNVKLLATEKREQLASQLRTFERETGWRVRAYTTYANDGRPSDQELRAAWRPDARTVVVNFDASNPNLTNVVYLGDEVLAKLRRPWWFELQGRYGNMFYVREEGEQAAVLSTMNALTTCLGAPEGCKVVPGLPSEQYWFTLALSVAGGLVAGGVSRLEPAGWVQSRWTWLLIFSPLWASLFINFGLGPVVSRTSDLLPVAGNTAGFLLAAFSPYLLTKLWQQPEGPSPTTHPQGMRASSASSKTSSPPPEPVSTPPRAADSPTAESPAPGLNAGAQEAPAAAAPGDSTSSADKS